MGYLTKLFFLTFGLTFDVHTFNVPLVESKPNTSTIKGVSLGLPLDPRHPPNIFVDPSRQGQSSIPAGMLIFTWLWEVSRQWAVLHPDVIYYSTHITNQIFPVIDIFIVPETSKKGQLSTQIFVWALLTAIHAVDLSSPDDDPESTKKDPYLVPSFTIIYQDNVLGTFRTTMVSSTTNDSAIDIDPSLEQDASLGISLDSEFTGQAMSMKGILLIVWRLLRELWAFQAQATVGSRYGAGSRLEMTFPEMKNYVIMLALYDVGPPTNPVLWKDLVSAVTFALLEPIKRNKWQSCVSTLSKPGVQDFAKLAWCVPARPGGGCPGIDASDAAITNTTQIKTSWADQSDSTQ
ncbi:uncharacterized protein KY384_006207 [Bacidia gigantensis]|uniref:uncharacterized protein n=1 Tax=Bacidia gigantensis TaxID=2732470 RepID=UPI001D04C5E2|nr:uncharacterized protein KY384_006207 [Bacidia gigantensis]KAG8529570.1 hypothetical protein KY384_006207 [Bacidia gigantensis]